MQMILSYLFCKQTLPLVSFTTGWRLDRSHFSSNVLHMKKFGAITNFMFNWTILNITVWFRYEYSCSLSITLTVKSCLEIFCKFPKFGQRCQLYKSKKKKSHRLSLVFFTLRFVLSQLKLIIIPFIFLSSFFTLRV